MNERSELIKKLMLNLHVTVAERQLLGVVHERELAEVMRAMLDQQGSFPKPRRGPVVYEGAVIATDTGQPEITWERTSTVNGPEESMGSRCNGCGSRSFLPGGQPSGHYPQPQSHVRGPADRQFQGISTGDQQIITSEKTLRQYSDLEQTLKVEGDIPSLVLTVTEKSRQRAAGSQ